MTNPIQSTCSDKRKYSRNRL